MTTLEGSRAGIGGTSTSPPPRLREDVRVLRVVRFEAPADVPVVPVTTDADGLLPAPGPPGARAEGAVGGLAVFGGAIPQTLQ
jgi:hypothetical protein